MESLTDAEIAARLAVAAGKILLSAREAGVIDGKPLGETGDQTANQFLCGALAHCRPEDGLLSEENKDTDERLSKERVWIIDPLDGTREYGEARTDWAVHVGLAVNGEARVGAVALPGLDLVLRSDAPVPAPARAEKLRMVVSRTRPAKEAVAAAEALGADLVPMGSAGAKAMAVVRGEADIYLHSGGQYEWDNCAPVAIAQAHGLHCSRIDGAPLAYNNKDTYLPDLLICHKADAERIIAIVCK